MAVVYQSVAAAGKQIERAPWLLWIRFVGRSVDWSVGRWLARCSLARLLEGGLSSSIEEMFLHRN